MSIDNDREGGRTGALYSLIENRRYSIAMMHSVYYILVALWRARVALCLPIWLSVTVSTALGTLLFVGRSAASVPQNRRAKSSELSAGQMAWRCTDWLAALLFSLFLACYIALTTTWEDFAYYGNN